MFTVDIFSGPAPKRGDLFQTNIDSQRERTWLVLSSRKLKSKSKYPRYRVWAARWWELEPEMRVALYRSAERHGGQRILFFRRYPKKKKSFEQYMGG